MPLYTYECTGCARQWDSLEKHGTELIDCNACGSPAWRVITTIGGYAPIKNNGASVRPKNAGSRK